jgi:hypothetical protein
MTTEEASRRALYDRLTEVLGDEHAMTLFSYLPQSGEPATKADLNTWGDRLDARMDGLDARMDGLDVRMDGLDERMGRFEERMDQFGWRLDQFHVRLDGFHDALRHQTRTFTLAIIGSITTVAALALGARLL